MPPQFSKKWAALKKEGIKIYRRYPQNTNENRAFDITSKQSSQRRQTTNPKNQLCLPPANKSENKSFSSGSSGAKSNQQSKQNPNPQNKEQRKKTKGIMGLLDSFLPSALYNRENKKIFGILSAEDLLLLALILVFADSGEDDTNLICLALIYVLISDYIDLSDYF